MIYGKKGQIVILHRQDHRRTGSGWLGTSSLRSFIGGLRQNDRGLYVSTGGFTKEARYEADRSTVPVTLIDIDDLADLLIRNYDTADTETKAFVPMVKIYWPA